MMGWASEPRCRHISLLLRVSATQTRPRAKQLTEKSVRQGNRINPLHIRIRRKIRINEEENRHIHRLPRIKLLLLKAEALNLAEIRRHLSRRHAICCDSNDIRRTLVRRGVEG